MATEETFHKVKKFVILAVIFIVAVIVLLTFWAGTALVRQVSSDERSSNYSLVAPAAMPGSGFIGEKSFDGDFEAVRDASKTLSNSVPSEANGVNASTIVERKVMQDGTLSLIVKEVEEGVENLAVISKNLGGRVETVNYNNSDRSEKKRATVVVRVPAVNFDQAMSQFKKSAIKVESQNTSTRDVTDQFIDLQARLKTYKVEEEQYLAIMEKATKVSDILDVTSRLSEVRTRIEQLQGQMNYISRQVDMSTITAYLTSEPDIQPTNVIWSPGTTVKDAAQGLVKGVYGFFQIVIYTLIFFLPIMALWGVVAFLFAWGLWKIFKKTKSAVRDTFEP